MRILKIDTVGFTNQANGKELLTPITNRNDLSTGTPPADAENQNQKEKMKAIATRLKLSADASEDAVLAEVEKLQNRIEIAEKELGPLKNRVTTIEAENQTLLGEQVDALLDAHGVKEDKVRNRMRGLILPLKNREDRVSALIDCGHKPLEAGKSQQRGSLVLNRGDGKQPGDTRTETVDGDQRELADKIKNRADELKGSAPARAFSDCWNQAQRELVTNRN